MSWGDGEDMHSSCHNCRITVSPPLFHLPPGIHPGEPAALLSWALSSPRDHTTSWSWPQEVRDVNSQWEVLLTPPQASLTSLHLVFARPLMWVPQVSSPLQVGQSSRKGAVSWQNCWSGTPSSDPWGWSRTHKGWALAALAALGAGERRCRAEGKGWQIIHHLSCAIHEMLRMEEALGCHQRGKWRKAQTPLSWESSHAAPELDAKPINFTPLNQEGGRRGIGVGSGGLCYFLWSWNRRDKPQSSTDICSSHQHFQCRPFSVTSEAGGISAPRAHDHKQSWEIREQVLN